MRLLFDPAVLQWFNEWKGEFDWDEGNLSKNEKHGITHEQIETIFHAPIYIAGKIIGNEMEPRWLILGETASKKWALIVTSREHKLRIISCRRQREKEELAYENYKKEL